jgi:biopolymer transport protein ExbD
MSVHAPGRFNRGMGRVGHLRNRLGRAIARALPSSAPAAGGRRSVMVGLSMTSMIDVLVVMTVFLLLTFQSSAECGCGRDLANLPTATNVQDMIDAPMVDVSDMILVDGSLVATRGDLVGMQGRVARLDDLFNMLKAKRETWKLLHPGHEPLGHVILSIDGNVPANVVKSVVMTAARSGYPSVDFMVHAGPKKG